MEAIGPMLSAGCAHVGASRARVEPSWAQVGPMLGSSWAHVGPKADRAHGQQPRLPNVTF